MKKLIFLLAIMLSSAGNAISQVLFIQTEYGDRLHKVYNNLNLYIDPNATDFTFVVSGFNINNARILFYDNSAGTYFEPEILWRAQMPDEYCTLYTITNFTKSAADVTVSAVDLNDNILCNMRIYISRISGYSMGGIITSDYISVFPKLHDFRLPSQGRLLPCITEVIWQKRPATSTTWQDFNTRNEIDLDSFSASEPTYIRRKLIYSGNKTFYSNEVLYTPYLPGKIIMSKSELYKGESALIGSEQDASGGSVTYSWQKKYVGENAWTAIPQASSATYTTEPITQVTSFRRVAKFPASTLYSNEILCTPSSPGRIITSKSEIQKGDSIFIGSEQDASGRSIVYSWERKYTDENTWTTIPKATAATYITEPIMRTTAFRRVAKSSTLTLYSNEILCTLSSSGQIITSKSELYKGESASISSEQDASGGSFTYSWQKKYAGETTWITIPQATAATYTTEPITRVTTYRRVANFPSSTLYSNEIKINVLPNFATTNTLNYVLTKTYTSADTSKYHRDIAYMDGFGRKFQVIAVGASPAGRDVVQVYRYGVFGRVEQEYLPFVRQSGANGTAIGSPTEVSNWSFYGNDAAAAFSKTTFDGSPLDRPIKTVGAGAAWHSADKGATMEYLLCEANEVKLWRVGDLAPIDDGYYAIGTLTKTITRDEDGTEVQEFKDNEDRVVLSQTIDGATKLQTYYVYDDLGLLRYVLTPEANAQGVTDQTVADYCYVYKYDNRQRLIEKKLPGNAPIYCIYDAKDRLVLSQDGNQRGSNKWSYVIYNLQNKPIETGETVNTSDRVALATQLKTVHNFMPELRDSLAISHYGNYDYNGVHPFNAAHNVSQNAPYQHVTGLVTHSKTRVLGTNVYLNSTTYYDDYCRPIQTITDCYPNTSHKSYCSFRYDFVGNIIQEREAHQTGDGTFDIVIRTNTYDVRSRLLSQVTTLNGTSATVDYVYDELGRQVGKKYGNNTYSESCAYNIRGWLTDKNSPQFSMKLRYEAPEIDAQKARYNGNISEWQWKQGDNAMQCYQLDYNNINQLKEGVQYAKSGDVWSVNNLFNEQGLTYDLNGNIKTLKRNANGSLTDDLNYTYNGNRLIGLSGVAESYLYDANGNMTKDARKSCNLQYNCLNLVNRVTDNSGSTKAEYDWLANGQKLRVKGADGSGYSYRGSLIYNASGLESAAFGEGRIVKTTGGYDVQYNITDHLGSVRVIVDSLGSVIEQNDYYPFGGKHQNALLLASDNRFKYNGKELQTVGDLGYMDYGARMYDSHVGRWFGVDPLAEDFADISPYAYCLNNPINLIDMWGLKPEKSEEDDIVKTVDIEPIVVTSPKRSGFILEPKPIQLDTEKFHKDLLAICAMLAVLDGPAPYGDIVAGISYLTGISFLLSVDFINNFSSINKEKSSDSVYNDNSSEHTSNKRKSTENKHQKGQSRKNKDQGNEKGDQKRKRYK